MSVPTHGPDCVTHLYPSRCPACRDEVFRFKCSCGSNVLFDRVDPFELHRLHASDVPTQGRRPFISLRVRHPDARLLRKLILGAANRWRRSGVLSAEPRRLSSSEYEVLLMNVHDARTMEPLADLLLEGAALDTGNE
jgi:hypothetical protein